MEPYDPITVPIRRAINSDPPTALWVKVVGVGNEGDSAVLTLRHQGDPGYGVGVPGDSIPFGVFDLRIGSGTAADPDVPNDVLEENSGNYIIIVNNDFDEQGSDIGMSEGLFGMNYWTPVTDLEAQNEIVRNDGEVRRMTIPVNLPEEVSGELHFTTASLLPGGSVSGTVPLIRVWYYDPEVSQWKTVATASPVPDQTSGQIGYIPVEGSMTVVVYLEAQSTPDFWDKWYAGKAYYEVDTQGNEYLVKEAVGVTLKIGEQEAMATAKLQVADLKTGGFRGHKLYFCCY